MDEVEQRRGIALVCPLLGGLTSRHEGLGQFPVVRPPVSRGAVVPVDGGVRQSVLFDDHFLPS